MEAMSGGVGLALAGNGVCCQLGVQDALEESRRLVSACLEAVGRVGSKEWNGAVAAAVGRC